MTDRGRRTPRAEVRQVATYLTELRAIVDGASASRAAWIRQLGALLKDARAGAARDQLAQASARIGLEQRARFGEFLRRLVGLEPPPLCQDVHLIASGWLEKQIAACDVMVDVGRTGDVAALRATQGLLAEGRDDSRRFSVAYAELVAWLKERLAAGAQPKRSAGRRNPLGGLRWPLRRR
jgi:hypothetical protein